MINNTIVIKDDSPRLAKFMEKLRQHKAEQLEITHRILNLETSMAMG